MPMPAPSRRILLASACLAGGLLAGPAFAQHTTVYGVIDAFAGSIRTESPGAPAVSRTVVDSGGMQTSFVGVAGAEDLGGGLKAVFQLEAFLRNDTGGAGRFDGDAFWARSAAVGFEGGFGRTTFGRNTAPYFVSLLEFNPLADSFVVGPMIAHTFRGTLAGDTGMSNSIRLQTRGRGPWRTDLLWSAGEERGTQPDRKRGRAFDGAIHYGSGPFAASLAYRSIDLSGTLAPGDGREQKAWLLGASYDLKAAKLFAQYQDIADSGAARPPRSTSAPGSSAPRCRSARERSSPRGRTRRSRTPTRCPPRSATAGRWATTTCSRSAPISTPCSTATR